MEDCFRKEFTQQSIFRNNESVKRIIACLRQIEETELWKRPNEHSNSMANLILHLCGNITQYIISALGDTADTRERDKEFSRQGGYKEEELIEKLVTITDQANQIIKNISDDDLKKVYHVQGFSLSGIGIIIHVTEHLSYHTGQIAFYVKQVSNKDLGFYRGVDLNEKNKK